jgi:predicted transcriptional regulator
MLGLDAIMAELYAQGRKADDETVSEIMNRLESKKNYIPSSERARKDYAYSLLKEYRKYIKDQTGNNR